MRAYSLTPQAKADIFEIWSYIAEDSVSIADRVERAIFEACELLAGAPLAGHLRQDLTTRPVRFWTLNRYPSYMIVYRPETAPLQIIAVVHGKRNLPPILETRR